MRTPSRVTSVSVAPGSFCSTALIRLILPVGGLLATAAACLAGAVGGTNRVSITPAWLGQLNEEMRTNHPAMKSAGARLRAAGFNTNSVRSWEDPLFRFGGRIASPRGFKPSEEGDLVYALEQKLPLFGKAQAARRVAQTEADVQESRLAVQFQTLRRDLAKAVFAVALAERVVEIGGLDLTWLETMSRITGEHLRAGTATQIEVLRVQNERARRAEQLQSDRQRLEQARVAVNRLLGRPLALSLPGLVLPPPAGPVPYSERLAEYAIKSEPKLRMLGLEIQQAGAAVEVTRRSRRPEVSFGIEGRQFSGDGGFREGAFMLGMSLPWINRSGYQSDLARDRARLEAAQLDAADYAQAVREEVHQLTVKIDAARREARLSLFEILPWSEQALASAHANWQAGRGLFNDSMEARRMVLEAQLMAARAVTEQYQMMSDLVLCCGLGDLEALETLGLLDGATTEPRQP